MSTPTSDAAPPPAFQRLALGAMALCLAVMALSLIHISEPTRPY